MRQLTEVAVFLLGGTLLAQQFRGSLTGVVTDAQGGGVPGVQLTATNIGTQAVFRTTSGADGQYTLPFLAPGAYQLSAEAQGFRRFVLESVTIGTNEITTVDVKLELGSVADSITVNAETPLLQTATASVGQVINQRQIEMTPLNGRSPLVLAQLAFGVIPNGDPQQSRPYDDSRQSGFAMGGGISGRNELLLDGAPDMGEGGRIAFSPPVDAVDEVKVESFQADAAYGHTGGGTVNLVTKSGTNAFHGSAYEFNQVSRLAATQFFTNSSGQRKAVTRYNQWGATAGGPVLIPGLVDGRNRVFFFFAYEGIKTGIPQPTTLTVPTAAERNGDFSALLAQGAGYQIYDPLSGVREGNRVRRSPFPNNIIPPDRQSAIGKNLLSFYPLPNQPGRPDGRDNFLANTVTDDKFDSETGRIDFNISERHKLFFNFRHNDRNLFRQDYFENAASGTQLLQINWGSMLDHVWSITPTMVLNSRVNWTRNIENRGTQGTGYDITSLGFPASLAAMSPLVRFPVVSVGSYAQLGSGSVLNNPWDSWQGFSSLTKIAGAHSLKVGADLRLVRFNSYDVGNSTGLYSFGTNWTRGPLDNSAASAIGQDLASLLLGLPSDGSFDLNAAQSSQAGYYALFVQDDWRVKRNLTLNLGLRYERDLPTTERYNRSVNGFDFTTPNPISADAAAAYAGNPIPEVPPSQFATPGGLLFASPEDRRLYATGAHYFGPRFGFAWQLPGMSSTVVRGGFGVFFYSIGKTGVQQTGFSQTTPLVATNDGYLSPATTIDNPFPAGLQQPTGSSLGLATYLGRGIAFSAMDRLNPYSVRWNVDIQRSLPGNAVLELGYIGNHSVHLDVSRQLNYVPTEFLSRSPVRDQPVIDRLSSNVANPFVGLLPGTTLNGTTVQRQQLLMRYPQFTDVSVQGLPEGSSYFHMFQARVEKRYSHGIQFLGNYLWSKLIERRSFLNPNDAQPEKRIGADDRPQRLVLSTVWEMPFGKGRAFGGNSGPITSRLIGGWNISAIYTWQPGAPLTWGNVLYYGGDIQLDSAAVDGAFDTTRFNTNPQQQLQFNLRNFPSQFGNLRADSLNNVDFAVLKNTAITERVILQYRCEFFNFLNHPSFAAPNTTPANSNFGKITSQANLSRSIQMGLRLRW